MSTKRYHALAFAIVATMQQTAFAQTSSYDLAIAPLSQTMAQIARQNSVTLSADPELLKGKTAPAIRGNYDVNTAFNLALVGSGLQIIKNTDGTLYSLKKSVQSLENDVKPTTNSVTTNTNVAHLPVIVVTAETDPSDESKNNYGVNRSSSATKLDLALKDTPQSITIITQKQIEEQALTDVNKILEATPGVTVQNFGVPGAGRATFYSRGYEINNVMVDGAPTLISGTRGMELLAGMDTVIYDRVEVTRGSTGLSTGTGDPSASINFVRKRPGFEAERSGKISWGTWGKKRVELDVSQPFTSDGSIRGRFVGAYVQGGTYIDRIQEESKILYGIIEADITDKTTIAVGGTWYDKDIDDASPHMTAGATDNSASSGVFDGGRSWNAATDWSYAHIRNWNAFLTLDHAFNDNWKLTTNYQYSKTTPDRVWGIVGNNWYNADTNIANYSIGREKYESKVQNLDISLLGKFELFGREAQIATGINGYNSNTDQPAYAKDVYLYYFHNGKKLAVNRLHMDDWNNGAIPWPEHTGFQATRFGQYPLDTIGYVTEQKEKQYGYFLSTKFEPLQDLKVILGTRYNHYTIENNHYIRDVYSDIYSYTYSPKDKWIPYAGLVYDLNDYTTAYASYTGIYKTQLEKDINDNFLPFIEGNSYEIGLKSTLFDNRLNLATAIFRMQEENISYKYLGGTPIDPKTGNNYECTAVTGIECDPMFADTGPVVSGFEINAQGQLTPKWLINAGYTYLHVNQPVDGYERQNSNSMSSGNYSYERPKHAINISTSYQVTDDLTVGGSIRWKYKTTQEVNLLTTQGQEIGVNDVLSQGSYSVIDLMARYKINQNIIAGLNIINLFDKEYKTNSLASLYGTPRSATVSLNFKF